MSERAGSGRGLVFITAAKLYFILSGFVVQLCLPRLLGSAEALGQYSLAMSIASVVNNVLIAATVQSVSKRVSEHEDLAAARLRQALMLQLGVGVCLSGGLFLMAPWLSALVYDRELSALLRTAAAVPLCYAIYAALVGSLNGMRLFARQAALDVTFSTVRTVGIVGAAALGFGAAGALSGFACAALIITLIALVVVGTGRSGPKIPTKTWFAFLLPIVLFQLMLNGMLLLDVWVLKHTAAELAIHAGLDVAAAAAQASGYVGFYRAGQNFAFVPYQLILSVTFIVFPLVSRATAAGDMEAARVHIRSALRFSIVVLFGLAAAIGGSAEALIRLAYPQFLASAETLRVLVFGQIALALFVIVATALTSAGRPKLSAAIAFVGLVVALLANRFLVSWVGLGPNTLRAAAFAASLGPVVALTGSAVALQRLFGVFLPVITLARCGAAAAVAYWVASRLPQSSGKFAPLVMLLAGLAYLASCALTGEITRSDLAEALGAIRNRKRPATVQP